MAGFMSVFGRSLEILGVFDKKRGAWFDELLIGPEGFLGLKWGMTAEQLAAHAKKGGWIVSDSLPGLRSYRVRVGQGECFVQVEILSGAVRGALVMDVGQRSFGAFRVLKNRLGPGKTIPEHPGTQGPGTEWVCGGTRIEWGEVDDTGALALSQVNAAADQ